MIPVFSQVPKVKLVRRVRVGVRNEPVFLFYRGREKCLLFKCLKFRIHKIFRHLDSKCLKILWYRILWSKDPYTIKSHLERMSIFILIIRLYLMTAFEL